MLFITVAYSCIRTSGSEGLSVRADDVDEMEDILIAGEDGSPKVSERDPVGNYLAGIYLFKVNSGNSSTMGEIISRLTINKVKTSLTSFWCFIVNFEQILHIVLVFILTLILAWYQVIIKTLSYNSSTSF